MLKKLQNIFHKERGKIRQHKQNVQFSSSPVLSVSSALLNFVPDLTSKAIMGKCYEKSHY